MKIVEICDENRAKFMPCIAKLAHEAFPPCELIAPFCVDELSEAEFEHLVAVDDGQFLGFATVRRWQNLVYLAFLAVNLNIRNSGVGAQILNALTNKFADAIVVAEIENPYENCCDDEKELRKRRLKFYERNGFCESGHFISYCGVCYEIIYFDGACGTKNDKFDYLYNWKCDLANIDAIGRDFKMMFDEFSKGRKFEFKCEKSKFF
jgi:hypothetical protein